MSKHNKHNKNNNWNDNNKNNDIEKMAQKNSAANPKQGSEAGKAPHKSQADAGFNKPQHGNVQNGKSSHQAQNGAKKPEMNGHDIKKMSNHDHQNQVRGYNNNQERKNKDTKGNGNCDSGSCK